MTVEELFAETGNAYNSLIHLDDGVEDAVSLISKCAPHCSQSFIAELIHAGDSWRERLPGLVLARITGLQSYGENLVRGLMEPRGTSIVPTAALLTVAVRDFGYSCEPSMLDSLDRAAWYGEIGFAIDWLHYETGIGQKPLDFSGPNFGQSFRLHFLFYSTLEIK